MPIADDVKLAPGVRILHPELVNLYGCTLGADTQVGPFVEIQRGVVVGRRCKISSHSFLCEGVTLEDGVFIGHGVTFTNDRRPRACNDAGELATAADWTLEPTRVCEGASIGSGATILPGVTIGPGALVGAHAVVTRDVPPGAVLISSPRVLIPSPRRPLDGDPLPFSLSGEGEGVEPSGPHPASTPASPPPTAPVPTPPTAPEPNSPTPASTPASPPPTAPAPTPPTAPEPNSPTPAPTPPTAPAPTPPTAPEPNSPTPAPTPPTAPAPNPLTPSPEKEKGRGSPPSEANGVARRRGEGMRTTTPLSIAVIGYGYWGPNLARNVAACPGARLVAICDADPARLALARQRHPDAFLCQQADELWGMPELEAVAIATPVATHHALALAALRAGKHALVEKPLAASAQQARELIQEADARGLVLQVDHTFIYTGAVQKIRALLQAGELGRPRYYDAVRVNLGLFQQDVNVLWDLAAHDLAIMDHLFEGLRPRAVSATGLAHLAGRPENIAYLTCFFEADFIAHVHVNWLAPVKVRRTLVGGDRKMIVYDDLEPSEKVKVYDKGLHEPRSTEDLHHARVSYRTGDMLAPVLDDTEALARELAHFVSCVRSGTTPLTDGRAGLRVVQLLEAADLSMRSFGAPVELPR